MKNTAKSLTKSSLSVAYRNQQCNILPLLNPKREELNPTTLKSFSGYQHLSETEAEEKCASLRTFARLLFEHIAAAENINTIDNQHVVSLISNQDPKIVAINPKKSKPKAA